MSQPPRLKIAIDASRATVRDLTGTENYARQLIHHLVVLNAQREHPHQLHLYFRDRPAPDLFPQSPYVMRHVLFFPRLWTHLRFAAALWRSPPDVTFVPAHTLPLLFPGPAVVTVHDLGFKYFPQAHPRAQRLYLDLSTRYSAKRAKLILADSQATADDLTRFYHTPPGKICVVYPGVDPPMGGSMAAARRKYDLPEQYFLFIGTLQPRKNIERLVQAFRLWKQANPGSDTGLVLAGGRGWLFDENWVHDVKDVYLPGYVAEEDKGALLAGATALVFPSLHEGFGFPIVEAMHSGTPILTSSTSSLPELAGRGALLVDPTDVKQIAVGMDLLSWHKELRWNLRIQGYQQAARFSWISAAEQVMALLEQAAGCPEQKQMQERAGI